MAEVGMYEAKTHLPKLVERVQKGEKITITRHGVPVARLEPVEDRSDVARAIERIRELRKGIDLGGMTIRELIEEGRRY